MKTYKVARNVPLVIGLLALGLLALGVQTQTAIADAQAPDTLHVEMKMTSASKIVPGEPIVLHYKIANPSKAETVEYFAGQRDSDWYRLTLTDAQGGSARAERDPHPRYVIPTGGFFDPGWRSLDPGEVREGDIVATLYLKPNHVGKYTLKVQASPACSLPSSRTSIGPGPGVRGQDGSTKSFTFSIDVLPENLNAEHAAAEALRRELNRGGPENPTTVAEELFSMPEGAALPTWQAVASDPRVSDMVLIKAADQLASRPTRGTANLLAQMIWGTDGRSDDPAPQELWEALSKIYDTAPPDLRQYVRSLYIGHGILASELDSPHVKSHPN